MHPSLHAECTEYPDAVMSQHQVSCGEAVYPTGSHPPVTARGSINIGGVLDRKVTADGIANVNQDQRFFGDEVVGMGRAAYWVYHDFNPFP
jgi:hypothetical protein